MLAAANPVSLCAGARQEDAGPSAVAGCACGLLCPRPRPGRRESCCLGEGGGSLRGCRLVAQQAFPRVGAVGGQLQPRDEVLLPRVRKAAAAAAAAPGGGGSGGGSEEREVQESEAGTKRRMDGSRDNSAAADETTHQHPKPGSDDGRREGLPQAAAGSKRDGAASAEGSRQGSEGESVCQKAGVTVWRADDGSARKRLKKRACSASAPESSSARRHPLSGGGDVSQAALGLSTLRTIPRHRWALKNSERRESLAC